MTRSTQWKHTERHVAAALGGQRVPITGRQRGDAPDVEHPTLAIEVKRRTRARDQLQAWVMEAMAQAEASAATAQERTGAVKTPVVVIEQTRWGHANEYYAVLRLNDLAELVGGDDD